MVDWIVESELLISRCFQCELSGTVSLAATYFKKSEDRVAVVHPEGSMKSYYFTDVHRAMRG